MKLNNAKVSAINIMNVTQEDEGNDLFAIPLSIMHYGFDSSDFVQAAMDAKGTLLTNLITKYMADYFVTIDPAMESEVLGAVTQVLADSAELWARVLCYWKYNNAMNVIDNFGNPVGHALNALTSMWDNIGGMEYDIQAIDEGTYNFRISNSEYVTEVLDPLVNTFLSRNMKDILFTFCGHFINLKPEDDSTTRLVTFDACTTASSPYTYADTKENFLDRLDELKTSITEECNRFTFLRGILSEIAMYGGDILEELDLTRDLARKTINIIQDTPQDDFYNLFSSISTYFGIYAREASTMSGRLLVDLHDNSGNFLHTEGRSGDILHYNERVLIDVCSYFNAFREHVYPCQIGYIYKDIPTSTWRMFQANPIFISLGDRNVLGTLTDLIYGRQAQANTLHMAVDMPISGVVIRPLEVSNGNGDDAVMGTLDNFTIVTRLGSKAFLISEQDYEDVVGSAEYYVVTDGYNFFEAQRDITVTQTLGKSGSVKSGRPDGAFKSAKKFNGKSKSVKKSTANMSK